MWSVCEEKPSSHCHIKLFQGWEDKTICVCYWGESCGGLGGFCLKVLQLQACAVTWWRKTGNSGIFTSNGQFHPILPFFVDSIFSWCYDKKCLCLRRPCKVLCKSLNGYPSNIEVKLSGKDVLKLAWQQCMKLWAQVSTSGNPES